jgi:RNA-binding protein 8A
LIEYATLDEAKAAIAGAAGKKILDQPVHADFAFIRGPKSDRGNRFEGRGGNRRGRSTSPDRKAAETTPLEARIEA